MVTDPLRQIDAPNNTAAKEVAAQQMEYFTGLRVRCVEAAASRTEGPRSGPYEVTPWAVEFENGDRLEFHPCWLNTGGAELTVVFAPGSSK